MASRLAVMTTHAHRGAGGNPFTARNLRGRRGSAIEAQPGQCRERIPRSARIPATAETTSIAAATPMVAVVPSQNSAALTPMTASTSTTTTAARRTTSTFPMRRACHGAGGRSPERTPPDRVTER